MTVQTLYLAMVLAAFGSFMGTLAVVSIWSRLGRRERGAAAQRPRPGSTKPVLVL